MKNLWFVLIVLMFACSKDPLVPATSAIPTKDAIQWQGVYHGIFPCPSCEGMDTTIKLIAPNKYIIHTLRIGSDPIPYRGNGTFKWDKSNSIIILDRGHIYKVYADHLYLLDVNFERIKGPEAERYRVDKIKGLDK